MKKEKHRPIPLLTEKQKERFWKYIQIANKSECWIFSPERKHPQTHGIFWTSAQSGPYLAHRISYFLATGTDPMEMEVCHKCDNPPCCNPAHLFIGTHQANMKDMVEKGRGIKGERAHTSKLNRNQVLLIRETFHSGEMKINELAIQFNVNFATILDIVQNRTWLHLPTFEPYQSIHIRMSKEKVLKIRQDFQSGKIVAQIAREMGTSETTVAAIVKNKTWKHISS